MTVSVTTRLKLKKYSSGGDPHPTRAEFNLMIDALEGPVALYSSGITSARPVAGVSGRFYKDTTAGRLYLDDGTAWGEISSVGGGGGGAAVTVGGSGAEGSSDRAARADHTHTIALATTTVNGAMPATDKAILGAATAEATAGTLVKTDGAGRFKAAAPSAATDVANKSYVDTAVGGRALTDHNHDAADTTAGVFAAARLPAVSSTVNGAMLFADKKKLDAASSTSTAGTLMMTDANGRYQAADPAASTDVANMGYVDQQVNTRALTSHTHSWTSITSKPTTFAPTAHTHAWGDITGEPATYAPSAHSHSGADITSGTVSAARLPVSTSSAAGTMSAADKAKLDGAETSGWADTLVMRDSGGRFGMQEPTAGSHGATKTYVDGRIGNHTHDWADIVNEPALVTVTYADNKYAYKSHTHWWSDIGNTVQIYNTNAASGSYRAVWVNSSGTVGYNLSSRKYKTAERDYEVSLALLDTVRPKWFKYKGDVAELGADAPERVNFIAEDLHDAGLKEIVSYNDEAQTRELAETINEQLMVAPLWSLVSQLYDRLRGAERRLSDLDGGE